MALSNIKELTRPTPTLRLAILMSSASIWDCIFGVAEVRGSVFFRQPFKAICGPKQLVEFTVMDIEVVNPKDQQKFRGQGAISNKHLLADAWVVKSSELGINDNPVHTRTHLGAILKAGDAVMGYCLANCNVNDDNFDKLDEERIPDIILVKKHYADKLARRRARNWKLKHLNKEVGFYEEATEDYELFLEDLEEDPVYRQNVNIFKDKEETTVVESDEEGDFPRITLAEMLEDLHIDEPELAVMEEQ